MAVIRVACQATSPNNQFDQHQHGGLILECTVVVYGALRDPKKRHMSWIHYAFLGGREN